MADFIITFTAPGRLTAYKMAEQALTENGFSVGHLQSGDPSGILLGEWDIQKWRNLSRQDRCDLHGVLTCPRGSETATIRFHASKMRHYPFLTGKIHSIKWIAAGATSVYMEAADDAA